MELSVLEEYFKFPLSNDDFGCYIFSEQNKLGRRAVAFNWLCKLGNQIKDKLVKKNKWRTDREIFIYLHKRLPKNNSNQGRRKNSYPFSTGIGNVNWERRIWFITRKSNRNTRCTSRSCCK